MIPTPTFHLPAERVALLHKQGLFFCHSSAWQKSRSYERETLWSLWWAPNLDAGLALNELAFKGIVNGGYEACEESNVHLIMNRKCTLWALIWNTWTASLQLKHRQASTHQEEAWHRNVLFWEQAELWLLQPPPSPFHTPSESWVAEVETEEPETVWKFWSFSFYCSTFYWPVHSPVRSARLQVKFSAPQIKLCSTSRKDLSFVRVLGELLPAEVDSIRLLGPMI